MWRRHSTSDVSASARAISGRKVGTFKAQKLALSLQPASLQHPCSFCSHDSICGTFAGPRLSLGAAVIVSGDHPAKSHKSKVMETDARKKEAFDVNSLCYEAACPCGYVTTCFPVPRTWKNETLEHLMRLARYCQFLSFRSEGSEGSEVCCSENTIETCCSHSNLQKQITS